jgi:hypothetical protein
VWTMSRLVLNAYMNLIKFDFYLVWRDFPALYQKVRQYPTAAHSSSTKSIEQICFAIDIACIWYRKEVLCLQRSAATACLLRRHGVPAEMIIGSQAMPFRAHAWVEVAGRVVNDKPYMPEVYQVLDRC